MSYQGITLVAALLVGVGMLAYTLYNDMVNQRPQAYSYAPPPAERRRPQPKTKRKLSRGDSCSICREQLDLSYIRLDCQHTFHIRCLRQWEKESKTCPNCRAELDF